MCTHNLCIFIACSRISWRKTELLHLGPRRSSAARYSRPSRLLLVSASLPLYLLEWRAQRGVGVVLPLPGDSDVALMLTAAAAAQTRNAYFLIVSIVSSCFFFSFVFIFSFVRALFAISSLVVSRNTSDQQSSVRRTHTHRADRIVHALSMHRDTGGKCADTQHRSTCI